MKPAGVIVALAHGLVAVVAADLAVVVVHEDHVVVVAAVAVEPWRDDAAVVASAYEGVVDSFPSPDAALD